MHGSKAVAELMGEKNYKKSGKLVALYHPECGYSKAIVEDFKKVANYVASKEADIDVIAVNMSKTKDEYHKALEVESYPIVRYYKSPEDSYQMDAVPNVKTISKFLKKVGAKLEWKWKGKRKKENSEKYA